jgi:hypothetical protein
MNILKTNWINFLGIFIILYVYSIVNAFNLHPAFSLFQAFVSASISICLYGILFWVLFFVSQITFDLIFIRNVEKLRIKLLIEWLVVSSPFIYWIFIYSENIFIIGVIAFFITQIIREKLIIKTHK